MQERVRWATALMTILTAFGGVFAAPVVAQQSGHSWNKGDSAQHPTQEEALRAYHQQYPAYEIANQVERVVITENEVDVRYWPGAEPSELQPWLYGQFGNMATSEEGLIAAIKAQIDQISLAAGCTPNTTVWRRNDWYTAGQWPDGVVSKELAYFDSTYQKRASPTSNCAQVSGWGLYVRERTRCANPNFEWDSAKQRCSSAERIRLTSTPLICDACGLVGNPIDVVTGNKLEPEPDFGLGWIEFSRTYHSGMTPPRGAFGHGWTHSHNLQLAVGEDTGSGIPIALIAANGAHTPYRRLSVGVYESTLGSGDRIAAGANGWTLEQANRTVEFDPNGRLMAIRNDDGTALAYQYDGLERLVRIVHYTGRSLEFVYGAAEPRNRPNVTAIVSGGVTLAAYAYSPDGRLNAVQYADTRSRLYHYEDARFPTHLTGITAEDGQRFSTFAYDSQGRAISSEHAGGAERTTLSYTTQGGAVATDASGEASNYALTAQTSNGIPRKVSGTSSLLKFEPIAAVFS